MPASGFDLYNMQDARNNFDAMRPTPICTDANPLMGQCQNIHISTNCYYGYHEPKISQTNQLVTDCEMLEATPDNRKQPPENNARKRSADNDNYPVTKRPREEVKQTNKESQVVEAQTNKSMELDRTTEDLLETLYWNIHGGNFIDLLQCF